MPVNRIKMVKRAPTNSRIANALGIYRRARVGGQLEAVAALVLSRHAVQSANAALIRALLLVSRAFSNEVLEWLRYRKQGGPPASHPIHEDRVAVPLAFRGVGDVFCTITASCHCCGARAHTLQGQPRAPQLGASP